MDTATRITTFIDTIDPLVAVLDEEAQIVKTARLGDLSAIYARKMDCLRRYEDAARGLKGKAEDVNALDDGVKGRLQSAFDTLKAAITANAVALRAAKDANQRVIEIIINAVRKHRQESSHTYAAQTRERVEPLAVNKCL